MGTGVRHWWPSAIALSGTLTLCVLACLEGAVSGALLPADRRVPHAGYGAASTSQASSPKGPQVDGKQQSAFSGRVSAAAGPAVSRSLAPPAAAGPPSRAESTAEDEGYGGDFVYRGAPEARGARAESSVAEEGARINAQQQQPQQYRQHQQQYPPPQPPFPDGGYGGGAAEPDAAGSEELRWSGSPPISSQSADGRVEAEQGDYY